MFSKITTTKSTNDYLSKLKTAIEDADHIIVGAGAGLSTSAGLFYSGKRFRDNFSDFAEKYGFSDMYSGGFYPYKTLEEFWAYWSRYIYINRYSAPVGEPYKLLLDIVKDKDYFVLTTNVDHQFQRAGFDKKRLFYTQGDYGLFQCSKPCHNKTYDNEETVTKMYNEQKDMKIPTELVPHCPVCGEPMSMNLRSDDTFVEDEGWHAAARRYNEFVAKIDGTKVLFLELGVGLNTPAIIKYPFWKLTYGNKNAVYACINASENFLPTEIEPQSVIIEKDIKTVLSEVHG